MTGTITNASKNDNNSTCLAELPGPKVYPFVGTAYSVDLITLYNPQLSLLKNMGDFIDR